MPPCELLVLLPIRVSGTHLSGVESRRHIGLYFMHRREGLNVYGGYERIKALPTPRQF